jgi:hypothetical protein
MALVKTDDTHYKAIAERIRARLSLFPDDEMYLPSEMPDKIDEIASVNFEEGKESGYAEGYEKGYFDGSQVPGKDYDTGWSDGYDAGYDEGWSDGFDEGERTATEEVGELVTAAREEGYQTGITEGTAAGKEAERTTLWNVFQNNGGTQNYYYAFAYNKFTDENYNPIHPIRCLNGSTPGQNMFYKADYITDTKVEIYANSNNLNGAFNSCGLVKIRKIHVHETTELTAAFAGTVNLVDIDFEGTIGKSIDFASNPKLSKASITSVMTHLSTTATLTATFIKSTVNKTFETSEGANDGSASEEWLALVDARPNATIALV